MVEEYAKIVVANMMVNKIILYGYYDIEPNLLIEEDDRSGFLESISKYREVVYSK